MRFNFIQDTINSLLTLIFKYIEYDITISNTQDNINGLYNIVISPLWKAEDNKVDWNIKVNINQVNIMPLPVMRTIFDAPHQKDIIDKTKGYIETYYSKPISVIMVLTLHFDTITFPSLVNLYEKLASILLLHKEDIVILGKLKDFNFQIQPIMVQNIPELQIILQIVKDYVLILSTDYRLLGTIGEIKIENNPNE